MKQLIIIAIVFTVFSCGNKKAEIVEQIKAYKDSLRVIGLAEAELKNEEHDLYKSFSDSMKIDFDSKSIEELRNINNRNIELEKRQVKAMLDLSKAQLQRKNELLVKKINFKSTIDSLELELKKY